MQLGIWLQGKQEILHLTLSAANAWNELFDIGGLKTVRHTCFEAWLTL